MTYPQIDQWREWYEAGESARTIARRAGRAHKTIITALSAAGVTIRPRYNPTKPPVYRPKPWIVDWCDECCEEKPLNPMTGWCSPCSQPKPTPIAARREVECGPGSLHSPALAATSQREAPTMHQDTPLQGGAR